MRFFGLLTILLVWTSVSFPNQQNRIQNLCPTLARDLTLIERFAADPDDRLNSLRLVQAGLPFEKDPSLKVFFYFPKEPATEKVLELSKMGIELYPQSWIPATGAHKFGFMLAISKASLIKEALNKSLIVRATAAYRKLQPHNDLTAEETGVAEARNWETPLRGSGVRLAILDSGFRPEHPDLPEAAEAMDYADYPDTSEDVSDLISGHGTHVAGIAFGNGTESHGRWEGMAPDCSPIYLKIGNDTTSDASSAAVIGAIKAAATWCEADILSMSYGGSDGFNDGSSAEEQAVDWAVGQGTTVFMSAGNSAGNSIHYSGTLDPGATSDPIQVVTKNVREESTWGFALIWLDSPDTSNHSQLSADAFDGEGNQVDLDSIPQVSSPRGAEFLEYMAIDPLPLDSSSFFIRVTNHGRESQQYHITMISSHGYVRFARPDRAYTVLLPSTADSCISVAAYTSRTEWRDYNGNDHDDLTSRGAIANFSSVGPRLDGVLKPNIAAPGRRTISSRDTMNVRIGGGLDYVIVSNNGGDGLPADYVAYMGTSMSSPAAAGTAALILEGNPDLTSSELRNLIYHTARRDEFTQRTPNTTWGWGKIDVVRALDVSDNLQKPLQALDFRLESAFPNPFNGAVTVRYWASEPGNYKIELFDPIGRLVVSREETARTEGTRQVALPLNFSMPSSGYYVRVSNGKGFQSLRITALK